MKGKILVLKLLTCGISERITSMMWISFVNTNQSIDYYLFVGSSEGYVRLFDSVRADLLYETRFHDTPVVKIKSQSTFHYSLLPKYQKELVIVVYSNCMITIDPKVLYEEIRNGNSDLYDYEKWNLKDSTKTNDACCLYSYCSDESIFEVMESKSEFDLIGVGYKPVIAKYSTNEIKDEYVSKRRQVSKIATNVATKVYSIASSWIWGQIEQQPEQQEEQIPKGAFVPLSNQFVDQKREIFQAEMDFTGRYLATSDSLGRIIIFDVSSMTAMKIFKGYREAECFWAFIGNSVNCFDTNLEQSNDFPPSTELFIVFAARRGILECWTIDGKRLFAITVGTDKRFVKAPSHFGDQNTFSSHRFYLISQLDGSIQELTFVNLTPKSIQPILSNLNQQSQPNEFNPFKLLMKEEFNNSRTEQQQQQQ